jgi:hypothetical protein
MDIKFNFYYSLLVIGGEMRNLIKKILNKCVDSFVTSNNFIKIIGELGSFFTIGSYFLTTYNIEGSDNFKYSITIGIEPDPEFYNPEDNPSILFECSDIIIDCDGIVAEYSISHKSLKKYDRFLSAFFVFVAIGDSPYLSELIGISDSILRSNAHGRFKISPYVKKIIEDYGTEIKLTNIKDAEECYLKQISCYKLKKDLTFLDDCEINFKKWIDGILHTTLQELMTFIAKFDISTSINKNRIQNNGHLKLNNNTIKLLLYLLSVKEYSKYREVIMELINDNKLEKCFLKHYIMINDIEVMENAILHDVSDTIFDLYMLPKLSLNTLIYFNLYLKELVFYYFPYPIDDQVSLSYFDCLKFIYRENLPTELKVAYFL